jgi:hypothetical protein
MQNLPSDFAEDYHFGWFRNAGADQSWREQHPEGHEQTYIDFNVRKPPAQSVPLNFERAPRKIELLTHMPRQSNPDSSSLSRFRR